LGILGISTKVEPSGKPLTTACPPMMTHFYFGRRVKMFHLFRRMRDHKKFFAAKK